MITSVRLLIVGLALVVVTPASALGDDPQQVDHFVLLDTDADEPVDGFEPLEDDAVIFIGAAPGFSVLAVTTPDRVGSVRMTLSSEGEVVYERTENSPPYALFGDFHDDYNDLWPGGGPVAGQAYTLTATPFTRRRARGVAGISLSVHFQFTYEPPTVICNSDDDCDDSVDCTVDSCNEQTGMCAHTPDNELCNNGSYCDGVETCTAAGCVPGEAPCAADLCSEAGNTCMDCLDDEHCDDGVFCNGSETCDAGECVSGSSPCADGESCDEANHNCENDSFGIAAFVMVDATTDETLVDPMVGGETIDLNAVSSISIVADTNPSDLGSVQFELIHDGEVIYERIENSAPYALFGDYSGDYNEWLTDGPFPGEYRVVAIPFTHRNGQGDSGEPMEIIWEFAVDTEPDCVVDADCADDVFCNGAEQCVAGLCVDGELPCDDGQVCNEDTNQCQSGCTPSACDDGLFCNGAEQCAGNQCTEGIPPCGNAPCNEALSICEQAVGAITSFTLVNASNNQSILFYDPLIDGTLLDIDLLPPLNIRANTVPATVGSVTFELRRDGQLETSRTENTAPYSLFGDSGGNYNPWPGGPVSGGHYQLTATAFSGPSAGGTNLGSLAISFSFFVPPGCSTSAQCDDGIFCNGTESCNQGQCMPGVPPCGAGQSCDESADACVIQEETPPPPPMCRRDSECDDRLFCNGLERCVEGMCLADSPPCAPSEICIEADEVCVQLEGQILHVDDDGATDSSAPLGSAANPYTTIQAAADVSNPGDTVLIHAGEYDSNSNRRATPVIKVRRSGLPGEPVTYRGVEGDNVILHGMQGETDILVDINASHIVMEDLELTASRRAAIVVNSESSHVAVRRCHAHHNDYDGNWIGGAFRTIGTVEHVLFEECISNNNSNGFQLRESPTQTTASAAVPPIAGNNGYTQDMPESQWDDWEGWVDIGPSFVTIRRCIAFDNKLIDEHSDGIAMRYSMHCVFEDNISFHNDDDGFDMLATTRCIARRNISFDNDPDFTENGDGNGIKIGVRGGLDNIAYGNISFNNRRGGIDMADTERAIAVNNTCFNNELWFGIWSEAGRSSHGVTFRNNICTNNPKGDIGFNGNVVVQQYDHNLVGDDNGHNWAREMGPGSLVGADPMFNNPSMTIDTDFPSGLSLGERVDFIRDQVHDMLGLKAQSPAVDGGVVVPDITEEYAGEAPDIGAVESH